MAKALGVPLTPWQAAALDVALERDGRRMAYPVVVWIVPRRAGKSIAALAALLSRAVSGPRHRAWYASHRREVGAAMWRDEWFPLVETSKVAPLVVCRKSNGSETMTVRKLGSTVRLFAPDGQALRSQNADLVVVDEALAFDTLAGERLEGAIRPAMARRPLRQLWIVSSAGVDEVSSPWLARYRKLGHEAVAAGERGGLCFLEYAAPPDLPWDDPATWRAGHPAVADGSIDVEALAADLDGGMSPRQFQSEYLGWWHEVTERGVDLARWNELAEPASTMPATGRWIAAEVSADRSRAAIAVAARSGDRTHVEVVQADAGTGWVADAVLRLAERHAKVRVDAYGPAANLIPDLAKLGDRLSVVGTSDVARACAQVHDLVSSGRLRHRGQPELDAVVIEATARKLGDAWLWDRRTTGPELLAATLAADAASHDTPPQAPGFIR